MEKLKVLLVDDEMLLLDSLEIILSFGGEIDIIGKATDGKMALSILKNAPCDLVLLDLNMNGMGGIEAIPKIKAINPNIKILVLTTFYDENNIKQALKEGASGYLLKDSGKDAIIAGVKNVVNGQGVFDKKVVEQISKMISMPIKNEEQFEKDIFNELTKREKEICQMIGEGYTNSQIANYLYISEGTVKNYISSIYDKTGIKERSLLAITVKKFS